MRGIATSDAGRSTPEAGPNHTEMEALSVVKLSQDVVFEGRTFDVLHGSHSYTPDWWDPDARIAVEVKGERIHSRDSRIMFDAARHEYPGITWVWARKRSAGKKGRRWEVEIYPVI